MMEQITSRQNTLLTRLVRLQNSKKYRQEQGLFVGDGTKLLEEAIRWAPEQLRAVVLQEGVECPQLPEHVRAVQVPRQLMGQISQMEAPEGALFLAELPERKEAVVTPGCLVLDVPVIMTEGCCDPYNPKTVRATMGAAFRTPPGYLSREELVRQCREADIPLLATALSEQSEDVRRKNLRAAAVVIGSEGRGVSPMLLEASDGQLMIPMHPRCESLNASVAAAIVLSQMTGL